MSKPLVGAVIGAAFILSIAPASATGLTYVFDTVNSNTTIATSTGLGNAITPTSGVTAAGGPTINYTATAWNLGRAAGATTYSLTKSTLGQYVGGFGVTSVGDDLPITNCGPGDCGTHQIDNGSNTTTSKSYDFVQLVFTEAVTLSGLKLNSYGTANAAYNAAVFDDDFSYGKSGTALTTAATLTGAQLAAMFTANVNRTACAATTTSNGPCADSWTAGTGDTVATVGASKVWYVAASIGDLFSTSPGADTNVDSFKLAQFTVSYTPIVTSPTPEPATWGMMVLGFGAVGFAIRRRRGRPAIDATA